MAKNKNGPTETSTEPSYESRPETEIKPALLAQPNSQRLKGGLSNVLISLVALIALVLAVHASYQNWHSNKQQQSQKNTLKQELITLKSNQIETNQQLDTITKTFRKTEIVLRARITALDKNLQTALEQRLYQKQDWLLLKARHYLELAQINAHWSDTPKTAAVLLQQADTVLQETTLPQLFPIRQAIAKEIAQLQALPVVDIAGLLSQLDAAESLVSELPMNQKLSSINAGIDKREEKNSSSPWRNHLQGSLRFLQKFVVVTHYDGDIKPMLSPLHQALLRESVRMNLQEAQWAILQNNDSLYHRSLKQALIGIERVFETDNASTQSLIKQLQALQQKKLTIPKLVIDQSLQLLNKVIDSKNTSGGLPTSHVGDESP